MTAEKLNILNLKAPSIRILHFTWFAFFLTFVIWFNMAPFKESIVQALDLSVQQWKTLLILNVALTIPARIVIGMLVDRFGPKIVYSLLLFLAGLFTIAFALANSFEAAAIIRFLMGFVGAGFVIGIRMIGEWFPARQVGLAEGIYGGWGNFGSAAAAFTLPSLALLFGGEDGWRYALITTGVLAVVYSIIYYRSVHNTPKGSTYFKPKKTGAMEVTSKGDFWLYTLMNVPLYLALAVLAWKLGPQNLGMLSEAATDGVYLVLLAMFAYQFWHMWQVNKHVFKEEVPEIHRYKFKQVAALDLAYLATFGSELAVVSMLPGFFIDTFGLSQVMAGMVAASYAFMNLVARPSGGMFSDRFGRKRMLMMLVGGAGVGYAILSQVDSSWPLLIVVAATMFCSFFVQAGEGAVFAMVPLVKRRLTGQIAGMVGAYGNVGAVLFLTAYSFVDASTFFMIIGATAFVTIAFIGLLMDEPSGQIAEVLEDGTVQMIDVS
ncbi:MAG: NarK family nitrate/nitrite MFS transporter [Gammaproteobacteria bacterium]|nr:MAG: NarK family nitrate/nitrite MFS transporter [Gammaproteobacteria bacterium]